MVLENKYITIIQKHSSCRGEGCNWCYGGQMYQYVTQEKLDSIPNAKVIEKSITPDQLVEIIIRN